MRVRQIHLDKHHIWIIGSIALLAALVGIMADLFSAWSNTPEAMATAISIDTESIRNLFLHKSRWSYVLGNYLAVFFLPLHMFGFYLIYIAIQPIGKMKALIFFVASLYLVAIATGFHGTLAFIGDTVKSGNQTLLMNMMPYWQIWGAALIIGYLGCSTMVMLFIAQGKTLYARKTAIFTPIPVLLLSTIVIALLPNDLYKLKNFLAVTGLNLPLFIFYIITIKTLLTQSTLTTYE